MVKLEDLTIGQFIVLVSGGRSILGEVEGDSLSVVNTIRNIILEYKEIADPAGAKNYLIETEEIMKAKLNFALFSICRNLAEMKEYNRVREILCEYGISAESMNPQRLQAEVDSRYERAKYAIEKADTKENENTSGSTDIRREFDAQTAALMAHFKFQIDTSKMKATVYAHLVARHNLEIKARRQAMKK